MNREGDLHFLTGRTTDEQYWGKEMASPITYGFKIGFGVVMGVTVAALFLAVTIYLVIFLLGINLK